MGSKRIYVTLGFLGVVVLLLLGVSMRNCAPAPGASSFPSSTKTLRVLTTFFPLYDFARQVGGDKITLDILFSQTPEVSSFTPADIQKINATDLVVKNGAGLEPILDDLIRASDNAAVAVVDTSRGVALQEPQEGTHIEGEDEEEEHGPSDPHIWLNPLNAIIQVQNIRDAFVAKDPANAAVYRQNADAYIENLRALDRELEEGIGKFPRKDFVAFHGAFQYFTRRYGLRQAAIIEEFPGKEPSPRYIAEVMRVIKKTGVRAIFSEPQFSPRIVEAIARDLALQVRSLDPVETGSIGQDSYISLMQKNLETLTEALQ